MTALILCLALMLPMRQAQNPAFAVSRVALPTGLHPNSLAAADFDGDGRADVAICGQSQQLVVLADDGRGGWRSIPQDAPCGEHPFELVAADLNGDGRPDLAVANHDVDYVTVLRNDGRAHFTAERLHVHSMPHPHTVAAADINGDSRVDLVVDSWGENRLTLLLAKGAGWDTPGTTVEVGRKPYVNVIAADLDGDGHIDLVTPNSGFDTVSLLFGDGDSHFERVPPIVAGPMPFMVGVADVNGDGRPDILVSNYSGHITDTSRDGLTWVRNDGHRHFTAFPERIATGNGAWRIATGDLNGDHFADAAFINAGGDTVTVVYGSTDGPRVGPTISVMPRPHNIAVADGRLFVITDERDELRVVMLK